MPHYILVTESGSDIYPDSAERYGVHIVPMHVNFDDATRNDDSFPPKKLHESYKATGRPPKTSGSNPEDFTKVFDEIHAAYPAAKILCLAYSAATTVSFRSAHLAAESRDYVMMVDTKSVSSALHLVVTNVAQLLDVTPDIPEDELMAYIASQVDRIRFAFIPGDLDYLRAGDRLSNVAFLGATLLRIKPTVEVVDGLLVATKKRRGTMLKYVAQLVEDFVNREPMDLSRVNLTYSVGCGPYPLIRRVVEKILADHGAQSIEWVKSGCVIASHAGPGAFGIAALAKNA